VRDKDIHRDRDTERDETDEGSTDQPSIFDYEYRGTK
jgi:hypothetical protein